MMKKDRGVCRNRLSAESFGSRLGNFLLNFGIAVVWLGRWTIKQLGRLWEKRSR
ncbi:MAG: hypothetical protein PHQ44_04885 [Anaerovibrio sp.]|nr:hypothetical protein [Anaerovibrio sp.]